MTDETSNQQRWPSAGRDEAKAAGRTGSEEPTVRVQFAAFLLALGLLVAVSATIGLLIRAPADALPVWTNDGTARLTGEHDGQGGAPSGDNG
jgi:hypothetical protein